MNVSKYVLLDIPESLERVSFLLSEDDLRFKTLLQLSGGSGSISALEDAGVQ